MRPTTAPIATWFALCCMAAAFPNAPYDRRAGPKSNTSSSWSTWSSGYSSSHLQSGGHPTGFSANGSALSTVRGGFETSFRNASTKKSSHHPKGPISTSTKGTAVGAVRTTKTQHSATTASSSGSSAVSIPSFTPIRLMPRALFPILNSTSLFGTNPLASGVSKSTVTKTVGALHTVHANTTSHVSHRNATHTTHTTHKTHTRSGSSDAGLTASPTNNRSSLSTGTDPGSRTTSVSSRAAWFGTGTEASGWKGRATSL